MNTTDSDTGHDAEWQHDAALHLLALSPLLAASTTVVIALSLGVTTMLVTTLSSLVLALTGRHLTPPIRLPLIILLIATLVSCSELLLQAYTFSLYQHLAMLLPLIIANYALLGRAENFARAHHPLIATLDGFRTGATLLLLMTAMGAVRELLGTGSMLADIKQLLPLAAGWRIDVFDAQSPLLLAVLPPGAFLLLGFAVALKNMLDKDHDNYGSEAVVPGSRRVRVTGKI